MESIDSYVQRRTKHLETYKDTAKDSKVKLILSFKKNILFVLNLSLNWFSSSFFLKKNAEKIKLQEPKYKEASTNKDVVAQII